MYTGSVVDGFVAERKRNRQIEEILIEVRDRMPPLAVSDTSTAVVRIDLQRRLV